MAAYVSVSFTPKDPERLQQYAAAVPATLAPYHGKVLARGPAEALHGESDFKMQVLIAFTDKGAANAWYESSEYQALIAGRDLAMDSRFILLGD